MHDKVQKARNHLKELIFELEECHNELNLASSECEQFMSQVEWDLLNSSPLFCPNYFSFFATMSALENIIKRYENNLKEQS